MLLIAVVVIVIIAVAASKGLFEKRADHNQLTINADGTVVYEEVAKASGDATDIRTFAQKQIDDYNKTEGEETVKLERFATPDDKIYLRTSYKDVSTYTDFTGYELYNGTVSGARKAGYTFDTDFKTATDQKASAKTTYQNASADAFKSKKVIAIKEDGITVKVPGTVLGTSLSGNVSYTLGEDTVTITKLSSDAPAQLTYIFYN